jgi:protoporphyrinogen/coproporphyrinogen III oxidase
LEPTLARAPARPALSTKIARDLNFPGRMSSIAIIGAGITGLTAAFYLKRKGIPVTVFEAGRRAGGVIQSLRRDGYLAESGPNTILETSPKIRQLIEDAGLQARRLDTDPRAEAQYLVRDKQPVIVPSSLPGFLTTGLFSAKAKWAVLREPFRPARHNGDDESLAGFVMRRLDQEFVDRAVDAFVGGIYAGDPYKLSVRHAFPRLQALEEKYGSLIKGQVLGARERKRRGEPDRRRAPKVSFDEGLQVLTDTLAAQLGEALKLNTAVTRVSRNADSWKLISGDRGVESEHTAVIYCGTAFKLAELKLDLGGAPVSDPARFGDSNSPDLGPALRSGLVDLSPFSEIRHPPVASLVMGFRCEDVAHPCEGFGMLIPKIEGFKILGTIFSSSLFPNRAPAGRLTLTSFVGGERHPEMASLPMEQLSKIVRDDLRVLLGARGEPTFQHGTVYPRAIPQYNVGFGRYRDLMNALETQAPGFFLAGHYRDGVALSDSILSGCNVADRVEEMLRRRKV